MAGEPCAGGKTTEKWLEHVESLTRGSQPAVLEQAKMGVIANSAREIQAGLADLSAATRSASASGDALTAKLIELNRLLSRATWWIAFGTVVGAVATLLATLRIFGTI